LEHDDGLVKMKLLGVGSAILALIYAMSLWRLWARQSLVTNVSGWLHAHLLQWRWSLQNLAIALVVEMCCVGLWQSSLLRLASFRSSPAFDIMTFGVCAVFSHEMMQLLSLGDACLWLTREGSAVVQRAADAIGLRSLLCYRAVAPVWRLLLYDLLYYFWHRAMHTPLLWPIHRVHHSATEMTMLTGLRMHFLEHALLHLLGYHILFDGLTVAACSNMLYLDICRNFVAKFHHCNIRWSFGWVGRWLLVTPQNHRIHHSAHPGDFNKNFGNTIVLWDRLFGTYAERAHAQEEGDFAIGVYGDETQCELSQEGFLWQTFVAAPRSVVDCVLGGLCSIAQLGKTQDV
jgi:sterol desaturase/sphingolipid hydroxylase (fatty acid hydroxylase superfamily)